MGIVIHSYQRRWLGKYSSTKHPAFESALDVLDHCKAIGAGGLQISIDGWTADFAGKVRDTRESYDLYLEGSVKLPKAEADVPAFERQLRLAKEAGAVILRAALGGRRYELFSRLEDFKVFKEQSMKSLQLAERTARRVGVKIAVENHKDFECAELVEMLVRISSEFLGACIDTGNSMALLEDPMSTISTLAQYALSTHIKDMAVREVPEGFLLSEVPLGQGILDLPALLKTIRQFNPKVRLNLEMITRDPLLIPCLSERYWATFPEKKGAQLAAMLRRVREKTAAELPQTSDKSVEAVLAYEEENILKSLRYAGQNLGMTYRDPTLSNQDPDEK